MNETKREITDTHMKSTFSLQTRKRKYSNKAPGKF